MNHYHPGSGLLILVIALLLVFWGFRSDPADTPSRDQEDSDE